MGEGGSLTQWLAFLLPDLAALSLIPIIPEIFLEEKNVDVAEVMRLINGAG